MYSHACTFPSNPLGGSLGTFSGSAQSASELESSDLTGGWLDRMTRESTWMLSALLLLVIVMIALWIVSLVVESTCGQAWTIFIYACCPSRAASGVEDVAATLSWEGPGGAKERVEMETPPASYQLGRHPEFSGLMKYLRAEDEAQPPSVALTQNSVIP